VEHRHEQRIACTLSIELYRDDGLAGNAEVQNVSKSGLCIRTAVPLHRCEIIHIRFPDQSGQHNWPADEHALVAHTNDGLVGLLFDRPVFKNLQELQQLCGESDCCPQDSENNDS